MNFENNIKYRNIEQPCCYTVLDLPSAQPSIYYISQTDSDLRLKVAIFRQNIEATYVTTLATTHYPIIPLYLLILTFGSPSRMSSTRS
jgi:hypothetical protein